MGKNAGNAVAGGCTGCILGAVVCGLLGAAIGAFLDQQDAARPQQVGLFGLPDLRLRLAFLYLGSCGAIVGALIGSIGGAAYAVNRSEKQPAESALRQPEPKTVVSDDPGASADEELARLKKRVQELEDERRNEAIQKKKPTL
jgi:hypothetical protein